MKKRTTEIFIFIFTALAFSYFSDASAGTCSSISRSSFGANTVLTSAELNSQFSTVYSATNNLDGGCITDGTLEPSALNASDFQPIYNNVIGGCLLSYVSASSVSVSGCSATINGNIVNKSGSTAIAFSCSGCSAESASTPFYVYIKGDSVGATVNLLINTTSPSPLGYNGTDKVVGRFYNNSASDIDQYSIDQWSINQFVPQNTGRIDIGPVVITATTTDPTKGTLVRDKHYMTREGPYLNLEYDYWRTSPTAVAGVGNYIFELPDGLQFEETVFNTGVSYPDATYANSVYGGLVVNCFNGGWNQASVGLVVPYSATTFRILLYTSIDNSGAPVVGAWSGKFIQGGFCDTTDGLGVRGSVKIPVANWQY